MTKTFCDRCGAERDGSYEDNAFMAAMCAAVGMRVPTDLCSECAERLRAMIESFMAEK